MYALVDANNFYASCERVFRPDLGAVPIAVLSNNDGCIIARSNEVKRMGIPMGAPVYKYRQQLVDLGVQVFSSNFALYGDMSQRMMQMLRQHSGARVEVYSIDEAFLYYPNKTTSDTLFHWAEDIRNTVLRGIGLPIGVGVAPTKTLAKIANHIAKRKGQSVVLHTQQACYQALQQTPLVEVWGIGNAMAFRLQKAGMTTAADLVDFDPHWVRQHLGVMGEKLQCELQGIASYKVDRQEKKQQIRVSRSFGQRVQDKQSLREALATFCMRCCEKLRLQSSLASCMEIGIYVPNTNAKNKWDTRSKLSLGMQGLAVPSNDPRVLIDEAHRVLDAVYIPNTSYAKAGVTVSGLIAQDTNVQQDMFQQHDPRQQALLQTLDAVNQRYGRDTLHLAAQGGTDRAWHMNQQHRSPHYTTNWEDIVEIHV